LNTTGTRAGAVTISLDVWHLDIPPFLECQTEVGDLRAKAFDIFPQVVVNDLFMERVKNGSDWWFFDPYEIRTKFGIELAELWGETFRTQYLHLEEWAIASNSELSHKVNAKDLFKKIMKVQIETGLPYLAFKDAINEANPNKHEGYIPGVNLCVAPETKILTAKGQIPISTLEGQEIEVWNGTQFSKVIIKKTGENQPLLKISFSNGEALECTHYHKFYIQRTNRWYQTSSVNIVEAKDLRPGDKLIKYDLPVIQTIDAVDFPYAYTSGFFCGDGSISGDGKPELDLYHDKKNLLPHIEIRNKLRGGIGNSGAWRIELDELAVYDDFKQNRLVCKLPLDIPTKFTVPLNSYTIKSKLEWLAGLLDSDGTVARNGCNESLQIASVNKSFLLEVRLMLQTLGVDSKVTSCRKGGFYPLPDGKGGLKKYECQEVYRLLISSNGLYKLKQLGLVTHRLQWAGMKPQRDATQFISVEIVENNGRISDTFCFNEPLEHKGMFNGLLTGQCVESFSNVKPNEEAHCCNLLSLNLANLSEKEAPFYASLGVRMLDNTIELTTPPIAEAKAHNNKYRTVGVGMMGLADWLAKRKLPYKFGAEVKDLFSTIAYHCVKSSVELAQERGAYPAYKGSDWDNGLLINSKPLSWFEESLSKEEYSKWKRLHKDIQKYGIRNSMLMAIAPNTSSSLLQGCTASILPCYSKFHYDKHAKGAVPIAPPFVDEYQWYYTENTHMDQQKVVDMVAGIQQWIDTGISMDLIFNHNREIDAKKIFEVLISAWEQRCKAVYYIRSVQKDTIEAECPSCAN